MEGEREVQLQVDGPGASREDGHLCAAGLEGNVLPGCQAARRGMDPNANVGYRRASVPSCLRAFVRLQLQLLGTWYYHSVVQLPCSTLTLVAYYSIAQRQAGARQVGTEILALVVYIGQDLAVHVRICM